VGDWRSRPWCIGGRDRAIASTIPGGHTMTASLDRLTRPYLPPISSGLAATSVCARGDRVCRVPTTRTAPPWQVAGAAGPWPSKGHPLPAKPLLCDQQPRVRGQDQCDRNSRWRLGTAVRPHLRRTLCGNGPQRVCGMAGSGPATGGLALTAGHPGSARPGSVDERLGGDGAACAAVRRRTRDRRRP